jgi:hypothetical protein
MGYFKTGENSEVFSKVSSKYFMPFNNSMPNQLRTPKQFKTKTHTIHPKNKRYKTHCPLKNTAPRPPFLCPPPSQQCDILILLCSENIGHERDMPLLLLPTILLRSHLTFTACLSLSCSFFFFFFCSECITTASKFSL